MLLVIRAGNSAGPQGRSPGKTNEVMREIKTVGKAIAGAIKACGGNRITQEAAKAASVELLKSSKDPMQAVENAQAFMNLSALNQELERCGLVKTERTLSALMTEVQAQLEA